MKQKWSVHVCALDAECRGDMGSRCWRLETNTPWWHLGVALTPGSRYVKLHEDNTITFPWTSFRRWDD